MLRTRFIPFLLGFLLSLAPLPAIVAQDLPATPEPDSAPIGVLATFGLHELPVPHAEVWFLRMGLEPGGSLPAGTQIGPTVIYVESGTLTLVTDRAVIVSAATDTATPPAPAASPEVAGIETVLLPGQSALVEEGTALTGRNVAGVPTTFLMVLTFTAEQEEASGEGEGEEPIGLSQQGISVATAEFPSGPGTLTMERIVVEPGDTMERDSGAGMGIGGIELGAVEQGTADVTFVMGSSWLWPGMLQSLSSDRQPIDPGATVTLAAGDGYSTYDGSSRWVVEGTPLTVLRIVIMPGS